MNSNTKVRFWGLALLLCAAAMLVPGSVWAQEDPRYWPDHSDPEPGIPIRQGHHIEWQRSSYRNDDGQILVAWSDTRFGDRDLFAQLINPDGSLGFDAESGKVISRSISRQEDPEPVFVGDGWIIGWIDYRADSTGDIYAKKININGDTWTGWDENGNVVDVLPNSLVGEVTVRAVHDGNGGAIIAWEDYRNANADIYAQHINSDGSTSWAQPLAVTNVGGDQTGISADTDGNGNMVVAWNDDRSADNRNIYAAKITPAGELPWGDGVNGILVCGATGSQSSVKLCSDLATGGCYLAWEDSRLGANDINLYMQRINGSGNIMWDADGIVLCNAPDKQLKVRVATDITSTGQVGVLTAWYDIRENGYVNEIYGQKTLADGSHQWTANGLLVCGNAGPNTSGETRDNPRLTSDLVGGSIITWDDTRNDEGNIRFYDLFTERVSAAGEFLWSTSGCGVPVCEGISAQWKGVLRMMTDNVVCEIFDDESRGSQTLRFRRLNLSDGSGIDADCGPELVFGLDGDATNPHSIEMDPGWVGIVWEDNRGGKLGKAIFYQVVDTLQNFVLPINGDTLCPENEGYLAYEQSEIDLASDGNNGFFVSFIDNRGESTQVRLARVNRNAEQVCSRAGQLVYEFALDQQKSLVCEDGNGGCYVAWQGNDFTFSLDVFIHHLGADCRPTWDAPIQVTQGNGVDDILWALEASNDGSCYLIWHTGESDQLDLEGARITSDGTVQWREVICDAPRDQTGATATVDNNGGLFVVWADKRTETTTNDDLYAQRLNSSGERLWDVENNGIQVISTDNLQNNARIVADGSNNLYVFWEDFRNGIDLNLYGQKLDPDGNLLWNQFGEIISDEASDQDQMDVLIDPCDGVYGVWTDARGFHTDIYGTHLRELETFTYADEWWSDPTEDGRVCGAYQNQSKPTLSNDGVSGFICAWVDWRASGKEPLQNIWGNWAADRACTTSVVQIGPSLVKEYSLSQNYPNPFNPTTEIEFSIPIQEHVEISIYNTLGQQVMSVMDEVMVAGSYRLTIDASRLASGIYFYNMKTPSFKQVRKMTLIR